MTREGASPPVLGSTQLAQVVSNQRRTVALAGGLIAASVIVAASNGYWRIGVFLAVGVALGLLNSLLTEMSMVRFIQSGTELSRKQFAISALVRLLGISLVAFTLAVVFWPGGATALAGLAIFHSITVAFTGLPLLKEVRKA
jgi:hypothetical protein